MENNPHHFTPCPPADSPPRPVDVLRDLHVVVVGAGPVGLLTAVMLTQRGARVTVVERAENPTVASTARTYTLAVTSRSRRVFSACPRLLPYIEKRAMPAPGVHMVRLHADNTVTEFNAKGRPGGPPTLFMRRGDVVAALLAYIDAECPSVTILRATKVVDAEFNEDGSTTLLLRRGSAEPAAPQQPGAEEAAQGGGEPPEGSTTLNARFVVGCDGARSALVRALRKQTAAASAALRSKAGLDDTSFNVYSSSLRVKSLVVGPEARTAVAAAFEPRHGPMPDTAGYRLVSRGNPPLFVIGCACMSEETRAELGGGVIGFLSAPKGAPVLVARDVDETFQLLQESLPQIDVRKCISEEAMRNFAEAGDGWPLGSVRRTKSFAAVVGRHDADGNPGEGATGRLTGTSMSASNGAVVLLGDAAHSAPPDLGQGLNAGLEDVGVLMSLLDAADKGTGLARIAAEYERMREPDVDGLLYFNRCSAKWLMSRTTGWDIKLWYAGFAARMTLWKMMPRLFNPPMFIMLATGISYGEMQRRAQRTTQLIWSIVFAVVAAVGLRMCISMARGNYGNHS